MAGRKQLEDTALWWRNIRETNNKTFLPLFFDEHRHLVLKGGGGSGKSIFAGRKLLERAATEPGHRFLVCRKVGRTLRESCFAQLRGQAADFYPRQVDRVNKSDMRMTFRNGSEILFAGLDDADKLKSIYNITGIWIEEASEVSEDDFDQLDIRLRGECRWYPQIILSFNPISMSHWLKKRFFDRSDELGRVRTHESTYRDNRFLPEKDRETLEGFRETNPYYYQVYCLGEWGVTGKTVFDAAAVSARLREIGEPLRRGFFAYDYDGLKIKNPRWVEDPEGPVKIYREPEKGRPYVIGGDTAGEGSDCFVGQVLDNITAEQVCVLRHQYDEDEYARQMYCLGMAYNEALLAVEANFSTYPVKELLRLGYTRQYIREREDTYREERQKSFGFRTDGLTRPVILGGLIEALRGHYGLLNDRDTLEELLTFVRNEKNPARMEAEPGAHDDCVMALAIAFRARGQQSMREPEAEKSRRKWTKDMWEDYYSASEAGREYLLAKWGNPM